MALTETMQKIMKLLKRQIDNLEQEQSNAQRTIQELQHEIKSRRAQNDNYAIAINANNDWISRPNTGATATIVRLQERIDQIDTELRNIADQLNSIADGT